MRRHPALSSRHSDIPGVSENYTYRRSHLCTDIVQPCQLQVLLVQKFLSAARALGVCSFFQFHINPCPMSICCKPLPAFEGWPSWITGSLSSIKYGMPIDSFERLYGLYPHRYCIHVPSGTQ